MPPLAAFPQMRRDHLGQTQLQKAFRAQWRHNDRRDGKTPQAFRRTGTLGSLPSLVVGPSRALTSAGLDDCVLKKPSLFGGLDVGQSTSLPSLRRAVLEGRRSPPRSGEPGSREARLPEDWSKSVLDQLHRAAAARPPPPSLATVLGVGTVSGRPQSGRPQSGRLEPPKGSRISLSPISSPLQKTRPTPVPLLLTPAGALPALGASNPSTPALGASRTPAPPGTAGSVGGGTSRSSVARGSFLLKPQKSLPEESMPLLVSVSSITLVEESPADYRLRVHRWFKTMASGGVLARDQVETLLERMGYREPNRVWLDEIIKGLCQQRWHLDEDEMQDCAEQFRERFAQQMHSVRGALALSALRVVGEAGDEPLLRTVKTKVIPGVITQVKMSMGITNPNDRRYAKVPTVQEIMQIRDMIVDSAGFTPTEHKRVKTTFARYDQDKDGVMNAKEVGHALSWLGASPDFVRTHVDELTATRIGVKEGAFIEILKQFVQLEEDQLRGAFAAAGGSTAGTLARSKLAGLFESLGHVAATPEALEEFIVQCGMSHASELTFEDVYQVFVRFREQRGFTKTQLEEIEAAFHEFDQDKSRSMDAAELEVGIQWLGYPSTFEQVQEVLEDYDIDESGEVELDEFTGFVARYRDSHVRDIRNVFEKLAAPDGTGMPADQLRPAILELGIVLTRSQVTSLAEQVGESISFFEFMRLVAKVRNEVRARVRANQCFSDAEVHQFQLKFASHTTGESNVIANNALAGLIEELYPNCRFSMEVHNKARRLLEASDENHDGQIDFHEFLRMMRLFRYEHRLEQLKREREAAAQTHFSKEEIKEARKVFQMFDSDSSGELDIEELGPMLEGIAPCSDTMTKELLGLLKDIGLDGARRLTFADFLRFMQEVLHKNRFA